MPGFSLTEEEYRVNPGWLLAELEASPDFQWNETLQTRAGRGGEGGAGRLDKTSD